MKSRNTLTFSLMVLSIVLLVVLQVFWLRSSYEKAYFDLHNKIDGLFRGAVMSVRDSALLKKVEVLPDDSLAKTNLIFTQRIDSTTITWKGKSPKIHKDAQIQVYISGSNRTDSIDKTFLRPIASGLEEGSLKGTRFIMRMDGDSLSMDSIRSQFVRNLKQSQLDLPFEIRKSHSPPPFYLPKAGSRGRIVISDPEKKGEERPSQYQNKIQSQWIRISPVHRYAVLMSGVRPVILKEITPQIFFCGVLTLVTVLSFIFMFRSIRSQERLMILKNDFISNITHELKTPIATVSVALEALKNFKGIDNPKLSEEYLNIAQQELGRLSLLADKVLTTSLFDEHGIKINLEKMEFDKVVTGVLDSQKLIIEKSGATIEWEKKGDDFVLEGSAIHLTNVIHNLLDNALKYSPREPRIRIALSDAGSSIIFSVSDNGVGIPAEYHKKIFEKFFRMPTGDVHNIKGYGLGLSYVESVVKSHKGNISVSSQPGEGSTFTVTLPKQLI